MIKKLHGAITVASPDYSLKITIPSKIPVSGQVQDFIEFATQVLIMNGDKDVVERLRDSVIKGIEESKVTEMKNG